MKTRLHYFAMLFCISLFFPDFIFAQWQKTLGPAGGFSTALYAKGDTLFTGNFEHYTLTSTSNDAGTLYMSIDHGQRWYRDSTGFHGVPNSFTSNGNTIFASTSTDGIFRSLDNAVTWSSLPGTNLFSPQKLATINGVMYVGTTLNGVRKSTDNGNNFTDASAGLPALPSVSAITSVGNTIFIGVITFTGTGSGLFKSVDNGASWQVSYPNSTVTSLTKNGNKLFAVINSKVYSSTDLGTTWDLSNTGIPEFPANTDQVFSTGDTLYSSVLLNDGTFQGWVIYSSINNGSNWLPTGPGLPTSESPLEFVNIGKEVYIGTADYGSVYRTIDIGQTWEPANIGLANVDVRVIYPAGNDLFCGSFSNAGVHKSTDGGNTWLPAGAGLPYEYKIVNAMIQHAGFLYAGLNYAGVYRSSDNAASWQPATTGLNTVFINCFASNGSDIYAGTGDGVYRSADNGNVWTLASPVAGSSRPEILSMTSLNGYIFAGTNVNGLFRSADNGASWQPVNNGLNGTPIYSLSVRGTDLIAGSNTVYISTNNGGNWLPKPNGLQAGAVRTVVAKADTLVAAVYDVTNLLPVGVSMSTDNGTSWFPYEAGIKPFAVRNLAVKGNTVFAATETESIWNAVLPTILNVNLESFTAAPVNNKFIKTRWTVAEENNIEKYYIERTPAGSNDFITIGSVNALNSSSEKSYEFDDLDAARNITWQYRLKITEASVADKYSAIRTARLTAEKVYVDIFPNPSDGHFKVFVDGYIGLVSCTVSNSSGQNIYYQSSLIQDRGNIVMDISAFPKGLYFLKLKTVDEIITHKLIFK